MTFVEAEIASQPDCWRRAVEWPGSVRALGDPASESPSSAAAPRGSSARWPASCASPPALGESDAFTASEVPRRRRYDRIIALTRSGTTTEVLELLATSAVGSRPPSSSAIWTPPPPELADRVVDLSFADEQSVVQTRFATSTLAAVPGRLGRRTWGAGRSRAEAVDAPLAIRAWAAAEQITFLGRGWTVGIAHEAALKFRESSSSWAESYPAMDYRHGPIAIAGPGRVGLDVR